MRIKLIAKEEGKKPELTALEVYQLPRIGDNIEYSHRMVDTYINELFNNKYFSCQVLTVEKVIHAKDEHGWYYIVIGTLSVHMIKSLLYE